MKTRIVPSGKRSTKSLKAEDYIHPGIRVLLDCSHTYEGDEGNLAILRMSVQELKAFKKKMKARKSYFTKGDPSLRQMSYADSSVDVYEKFDLSGVLTEDEETFWEERQWLVLREDTKLPDDADEEYKLRLSFCRLVTNEEFFWWEFEVEDGGGPQETILVPYPVIEEMS